MVPVPAPAMDEKQVKRAELVESPTTRLAFKVSLLVFFFTYTVRKSPPMKRSG